MKKPLQFNLILGVAGTAQAEHTLVLVRRLLEIKRSIPLELVVVATENSGTFFDHQELKKILQDRFLVKHLDHSAEFHIPHIELAEWADLIVVYPASANIIASCAHGFTDQLLSNIIISARCPIYFGPTMNDAMYESKAFQSNLKRLAALGYKLIPREKTSVFIHSRKKIVLKSFCSETSFLKTVLAELRRKLGIPKSKSKK